MADDSLFKGAGDGDMQWAKDFELTDTDGSTTLFKVVKDTGAVTMKAVTQEGGVVFNESGSATADFRVEGDTKSNLFFLDASADCIGINTAAPTDTIMLTPHTTDKGLTIMESDGGNAAITLQSNASRGIIDVLAAGTVTHEISASSTTVFNEQGGDLDFRVEGDNNQNLFFLDASVDAIGIGAAPHASNAILDLTSTTKGFRPPVMTTAQRDAISSPTAGLIVYNSDTNKLNLRVAAGWEAVTSA